MLPSPPSFPLPRGGRPQVASAAWRLQYAGHWAEQSGGKAGDELRLAAAQLRGMLGDEDEIRWRRRGVVGLVSPRRAGD